VVVLAVAVAAVGTYAIRAAVVGHGKPAGLPCSAANGTTTYAFDLAQAANAATIAAVGKRLGLADHAVTVGLAAALQESRLRNLPYGDLDSLGLFQQRPSQGWGTPAQVQTPSYAAAAFFGRLAQVAGWQAMTVADAAQAVQHSAAPSAYAQWEAQARVMAEALTGEVAAGFSCRADVGQPTPTDAAALAQALGRELGPVNLGGPVPAPRGWVVASWIVGHAQEFHVRSVQFAAWRWTAAGGKWTPDPAAGSQLLLNRAA
jgi:hypothetical protein